MDWEEVDGNGGYLAWINRPGVVESRAINFLSTITNLRSRISEAGARLGSVARFSIAGWKATLHGLAHQNNLNETNSMDNEELNVGNCPHCTKTLFRDAVFNSDATFMTRCPHCQKSVKVCVRKRVEIVLIPVEPKKSDRNETGKTGTKLGAIILLLLPSVHALVMDNLEIFDKLV